MISTILSFVAGKARLLLVILAFFVIGVIFVQRNKIKKLEKDNIELTINNIALKEEAKKKISDNHFDVLPQKKDLKEELSNEEKKYLKDNHLKIKDVVDHGKITTGVDTTLDYKTIETETIIDYVDTIKLHKLDFSNPNIINKVTFKSLKDSVFEAKSYINIQDSIRYTSYKSKVKVGTKRFLWIFKLPKYQEVTRIKVRNSNPIVKLKDVEIVVNR